MRRITDGRWVQYFHKAVPMFAAHPGELIPACGSDSVRRQDGRWGHNKRIGDAITGATFRRYPAFQLMTGKRAVSLLIPVYQEEPS